MVIGARATWLAMLGAAIVAGTMADRPVERPPMIVDGYRVLAADFHVHPAVASAAVVTPWDLVRQAQRDGLDALAITPHNQVFSAKIGRWFSRTFGGPTVIVGEEIRGPDYHLIALGIDRSVSWRQPAAAAIDEVHRLGGVAIAAHPSSLYWPAYDANAMASLDGSEVLHPGVYLRKRGGGQLREFHARTRGAAIGSSDYHGLGPVGLCRTYVFATDNTERAILDAIRARRTLVIDRDGATYGDPRFYRVAAALPRENVSAVTPLAMFSRVAGLVALGGLAWLNARHKR
jgi:hypothetical protein